MAELSQVYGLGVEQYAAEQVEPPSTTSPMNGGAMNGGAMNGGAMNGGGMNGGAMNGGGAMNDLDDEVDKTINKLKNNIQKQKTLNNLKHELKKGGDESASMMDKYGRSKKDVSKLFLMSLLVLLGLSMNDIVKYYLAKYIMNNELTNNNELYLRLSIPLSILLLVWTIKALSK